MKPITSIQINSGCRMHQDILKHRFNDILKLNMPDDFYSKHYEKAVLFFEYVGNNDIVLDTISSVVSQFPNTEIMFVIDDSYEGLVTEKFLANLQDLLSVNNNVTEWLIVSSNKTLQQTIKKIFNTTKNFVYFNIHLHMFEYDNVVPSELDYQPNMQLREKKFLCVNRQERVHRLRTIDFLSKNQILPHTFASCQLGDYVAVLDSAQSFSAQNPNVETYQDSELSNLILSNDSKTRLKSILPLELDVKNHQYRAYATQMPSLQSYFDESYISIVTEGDFSSTTNKQQFTEKVLKCFAYYHPFIVIGLPGTLELLQEHGFLTFNSIIDESYDKIKNDDKRINAALNEVKKLNELNIQQIKNLYEEIFPILEHNYNHFIKTYNQNEPAEVVNKILSWYHS